MSKRMNHYLLVPIGLGCLLCALASGCGNDFAIERFAEVEEGMTQGEVESVLGVGREIPWTEVESITKSFPEFGFTEASCEKWIIWGNRKSYGLVGFHEGKVRDRLSR